MAKVNWDELLGGIASTGIDAFRAGSAAGTTAREATRREDMDAFTMGERTPIVRMPIGGLGGMAKKQIEDDAGLTAENPIDYGAYNSPGAIGAAPEVAPASAPVAPTGTPQGGMGDASSRQGIAGATAQAPGGVVADDYSGAAWFNKLDPERRKLAIQGAEQAEATQKKAETHVYVQELARELSKLRSQKSGIDAADKIIQMRQVQMQHLVDAQDALFKQKALGGDDPTVSQEINKTQMLIDAYKSDVTRYQEAKVKALEAAELSAREAERHSKALIMMGAHPELVDNYKRTFMNDGYISDAERLILNFLGGPGVPGKKPSSPSGQRGPRPSPSPIRK
jgi:hypothetical protein